MKKLSIILSLLLAFSCLCACGEKAENKTSSATATVNAGSQITADKTADKAVDDGSVYTISTKCDYQKLAMNFDELVDAADLIVKIKVKETRGFIADNYLINTEITPQTVETYKSNYNGEKLYVNGGKMLYEEYMQNEHVKKTLEGHENPDKTEHAKYVEQSVDNAYIVTEGDEYIFFAKKNDDGELYALYSYQGTFKLQNGKVQNTALSADEPLYESLCTEFGSTAKTKSASDTLHIGEADFVARLK